MRSPVNGCNGDISRTCERLPVDNGDMRNHLIPRLSLLLVLVAVHCIAQRSEYDKEAELDGKGNIFVSLNDGKLIWMADARHCSETMFASDHQTVGCMVAPSSDRFPPGPTLQLEIYLKGGQKRTIEPGGPILDWHFCEDGRKVAVHFELGVRQRTYALYESATARVVEKLEEPTDERMLPQCAESQAQIQDESMPMSAALMQQRTYWIAKVLRQIEKIQPGMQRKDLRNIVTTEGGISNRFQRTYVYVECPYIKVTVKFKAASDEAAALKEDPEDTIESVSRPFLQWSTVD